MSTPAIAPATTNPGSLRLAWIRAGRRAAKLLELLLDDPTPDNVHAFYAAVHELEDAARRAQKAPISEVH